MAPPFFARKAEFTKRRENQTDRGSFRARPLLFGALTLLTLDPGYHLKINYIPFISHDRDL